MRRNAREICILLYLERTWERGCHLEYSIHGKELGLIMMMMMMMMMMMIIIIIIIMCGR